MDCCHEHNQEVTKKTRKEVGVLYTCPMHPEVIQSQPGMCPECGMALVPMSAKKQKIGVLPPHVKPIPVVFDFIPGLSKPVARTIYPWIFLPRKIFYVLQQPNPNPFYNALLIHEQVHYARQKAMGLFSFGLKYLMSRHFRLSEEKMAVNEAIHYLKIKKVDINFNPKDRLAHENLYLWPLSKLYSGEKLEKLCKEDGEGSYTDHNNHVTDHGENDKHTGHSTNIFKKKFWWSLILTVPIILYSKLATGVLGINAPPFAGSDLIGPVLGSVVFFYGGWVFIKSAWVEIEGKLPGMMTLISIAIITAYVYSMAVVIFGFGNETLFWELTSLITIMLLGHWLEMRAVKSARGALKELSKLLPDSAEVIKEGKTITIGIDELVLGDIILIRPGGKIPADGTITEGSSSLNEAIITGESKPVEKSVSDSVIAGTINGDGSLKVKIDKTGDDTFLSGVARLIADAQASKSRLQILSDRAAFYLTIIALMAGALAFGSWLFVGAGIAVAVTRMVAVLVIACPHALGLAVPLIASISTTKAAQNGFLVKQRLSLEAARNIDVVLFDKTGTLTRGEFGVEKIVPVIEDSELSILEIAATLNSHSEHPLAQAMQKEASKEGISIKDVEEFERVPGKGVQGKVGGQNVALGNETLLKELGVSLPESHMKETANLSSQGKTVVHLVVEGKLAGSIALGDIIREESREAIRDLNKVGVKTAMITGDSEDVAKWVAKELNIDQYFASVLPHEKSDKVKQLQNEGQKVAMVGDGVNDAPALAQADLGIAIGAGTNVAIESAGIILVKDDPRDIPKIIKLSESTYRKMVQNLWWAAGYNIVAIPLAAGAMAWAGIVLEPAVGAILMSGSTVIVAFNALLFRRRAL
jgi:Cu2+-exporting ATPase